MNDPHGIVPPDFPYNSIDEAEREIENRDDRPRCPRCGTVHISKKLPADHPRAAPNRRPERWRCESCSECHFDEPAKPGGAD